MRTTINLDDVVLEELKRMQKREKKSLGRLMSDLLAQALKERSSPAAKTPFKWTSQPMGARVDLDDRDAIYEAMEPLRVAEPPPKDGR